uniref:Mediator complex subunit 15 n=1 Tax=Meloidogyne javanica TaxID=6303 RepID=A0A915MRZ5_MELJA
MNYDDAAQQHQQQFYMQQRMRSQQHQRMMAANQPGGQQQPPQHSQQQMRQSFNMVHQPQQVMVRMQGMGGDDPNGQQQHYQHLNYRDLLQSLPPNVQNQIMSETNQERKKLLIHEAYRQQQLFEQQMQQQGVMGVRMPMNVVQSQRLPITQAGGAVYSGQQVVMQQPGHIQRIASQGSFGQSPGQPSQMYMPTTMGGQTVRGGAAMHPMPINQPYLQQQFQHQSQQQSAAHQLQRGQHIPVAPVISSQQHNQITPSNSVESNIGGFGIQSGKTSQQLIQHLDPGSHPSIKSEDQSPNPVVVDTLTGARLQNTLDHQLPRSAGTPLSVNSQQQQTEAEHPEYKRLLSELCKHKKDVKRLLERLNIDKPGEMKLKSSLTNVIQVMEGTRKGGLVTRDLLKKLLANVQTVKEQYDIARHFLVAARKLKAAQASGREMPKEPLFLDPWKDVRHLQIKIPEEVLAKKKKSEQPRKRGIEVKKEDVGEVPLKRGLLESMAESFSTPEKPAGEIYKIKCIDGSEFALNSKLSTALGKALQQGFIFDFDSNHLPISNKCPALYVKFSRKDDKKVQFQTVSSSSTTLFLLLPTNYPESQIKILTKSEGSTTMDIFLEKLDSNLVNTNSLDSVLSAWNSCF